jgi:hypothetical protein
MNTVSPLPADPAEDVRAGKPGTDSMAASQATPRLRVR